MNLMETTIILKILFSTVKWYKDVNNGKVTYQSIIENIDLFYQIKN